MSVNILIRADGNKRIGMGHIYRMLTLAAWLHKKYGYRTAFVVRRDQQVTALLKRHKALFFDLPSDVSKRSEIARLKKIVNDFAPSVIIVDLLQFDTDPTYMSSLRSADKIKLLAFTDDPKKRFIDADRIVSSDLDQQQAWYQHKAARYHVGFDYLLLNPVYAARGKKARTPKTVKRVLICMGGADHHNLTFKVLKAIDQSCHPFACDVVLNSDYFPLSVVKKFFRGLQHPVKAHYDVPGLFSYLKKADIAITAGGIAHLERLCLGVPGLVINQIARQADLTARIAKRGATWDLGFYREVNANDILKAFEGLIADQRLRQRMGKAGQKLVDGRGVARIGRIIHGLV